MIYKQYHKQKFHIQEEINMSALILDSKVKLALDAGFAAAFGGAPERYFSAPGRTEIGGNHTDHQRGRVLAGAVNLDTVAAVRLNGTDTIRIMSKGYPMSVVNVTELSSKEVNVRCELVGNIAEGYSAGQIQLSQDTIEIRGQSKDIDPVSYARVSLNIGKDAEETVSKTLTCHFFDENDNISLAINGAFVDNKYDEYIDIFVSI
jgi:galactokinase